MTFYAGTHGYYVIKSFHLKISDIKNAFEIRPRDTHTVQHILQAKSPEEKTNWMAALVCLQTRR